MRALLIRHGKTKGNSERRYIGRTDEPLSCEGREEAEKVSPDISRKQVYVSPLLRARQTAAILFPNAEQLVLPGLRETDFGDFEGRTADEMVNDMAYREWVDGMCLGTCPNGESREDVSRRAVAAFIEAVREAETTGEDDIVFVTHGGVIMSILEELAVPKKDYYEYQLKNLCGWQAECIWDDGMLQLYGACQVQNMVNNDR